MNTASFSSRATSLPPHARWLRQIALALLATVWVALLPAFAEAATLTSSVDRDHIGSNETLELIVRYDDNVDNVQPDIIELEKQFDVLSSNTLSSIQMINFRSVSSTEWHYELSPKHTGKLLIPSFNINGAISDAIVIEVSGNGARNSNHAGAASNPQGDLYVETELDSSRVHVQQQVLLTLRLVTRVSLNGVSPLQLQADHVLAQDLGNHKYRRTASDGTPEMVIEQRYALFPQTSGKLEIPAQTFEVSLEGNSRSRFGFFGAPPVTRHISSDAVTLDVMPAVKNSSNSAWLPASNVTLSQQLQGVDNHNSIPAGQAFTRVLRIEAQGLSAEQLPPLHNANDDAGKPGMKTYDEAPTLNNQGSQQGVTGSREEHVAVIASQPGPLTLPAIQVPWFNTATKQWQTATLPAVIVNIAAANGQPANNSNASSTTAQTPAPAPSAQVPNTTTPNATAPSSTATDNNTTTTASTNLENTGNSIAVQTLRQWQIACAVLAALWLITLIALLVIWRRKPATAIATTSAQPTTVASNSDQCDRELIQAMTQATDQPAQQYRAVLTWARQRWPQQTFHGLQDVIQQLDDETLRQPLTTLEAAAFGTSGTASAFNDAGALAAQLLACARQTGKQKSTTNAAALPALYH